MVFPVFNCLIQIYLKGGVTLAKVGFVSTRKKSWDMIKKSGYRERDIMNNAKFAVQGNGGRTISFYKKHNKYGNRLDHTKYDIATFDLKTNNWV